MLLADLVHHALVFFDVNRPRQVDRCLSEFEQSFVGATWIGWIIAVIEDEAESETSFVIGVEIEAWLFAGSIDLVHAESLIVGRFSQVEQVDSNLWRHVDNADGFLGFDRTSCLQSLDRLEDKRIGLGTFT